MFFSALSFLAGIVIVQFFTTLPDNIWVWSGIASGLLLAILRLWRLIFFVTGVVWAINVAQMRLEQNLLPQFESQVWLIEAKIIGLPDRDSKRVRLDV